MLIVGGTGLISTPITRLLVERGDTVTHYNRGKFDLYLVPEGPRRPMVTALATPSSNSRWPISDPGPVSWTWSATCPRMDQALSGRCVGVRTISSFAAPWTSTANIGKSYHTPGEEWMTWNMYHRRVAEAMGAPEPTLVHIPSDLLATVAPKHAGVSVDNFQFNNIFDTTAARTDLDFRSTLLWAAGARRMVAWLDEHGRIESSDDDPFDDQHIVAWQQLGEQMSAESNEGSKA
jgi:hypothetical protein